MEQGPMEQGPMGHNFHNLHFQDMQQPDMQEEEQQQPQEEDQEVDEAESMVIAPSEGSGDSVNMSQDNQVVVQFFHQLDCPPMPQPLMDRVVYGPVIPLDMQWAQLFQTMIPQLLSASVPLSLQISPFVQLKRSWAAAFAIEEKEGWFVFKDSLLEVQQRVKYCPRRKALILQDSVEDEKEVSAELPLVFASTPGKSKTKRVKKMVTPVVHSQERRFTRSCLKEGYRPTLMLEVQPKKKSRGRAKLLVVQVHDQPGPADSAHSNSPSGEEERFVRAPATPIHVLQRIGRQLGIDESLLTKGKLEAAPEDSAKGKSADV
jgi:hypothetical protein